MRYREATAADLPRIGGLLGQIGMHTEDIGDSSIQFVIAEEGENLVGAAGLEPHGEVGLLRSLVVSPSCRSRGIGGELCRQIESMAASLGVQGLYLLTETAAGYFARLGFSPVERSRAPVAIQVTRQFSDFCPATAQLLCREISDVPT